MTKFPFVRFMARVLVSLSLSALSMLVVSACVTSPHSRTAAQSGNPVTLKGYVPSLGETITLAAVDQNTGALVPLGTTASVGPGIAYTTPGGFHYTVYPWSWSYPGGGVVPANYWSPQSIFPDLGTAQGHLEIVASDGGAPFHTFSADAFNSALAHAPDPLTAANEYSDGTSTVLFDPSGVGSNPETPWVSVQGMISTPPSIYGKVAWSVGYYTVEGGKKIYGLICTPATGGPYPVVIFNHGGLDLTNGGNITGVVTAAGWTSQPTGAPDGLGQCLDWAKRGWVFATSSYRGEYVNITTSSPNFPSSPDSHCSMSPLACSWRSDGDVEFCLGEVTDVLALTDLLANHASAISVGSPGHMVPLNVNGKLFMYGYSHGGCITYRAVEQGAPVTAFSVVEGFSDIRLGYLIGVNHALTTLSWPLPAAVWGAALGSGAWQPPIESPADVPLNPPPPAFSPDPTHVMAYDWRSAHYFATHGDLAIQKFKTMPILILHGDVDTEPPIPADPAPLNPTPLAHAAEISADIGATNVFVGPNGVSPPTAVPCVDGPEGAAIPASVTAPNKVCPISFTSMDTGDPCVSGSPPAFAAFGIWVHCGALALPLTPPPGQPQQQHYLVVYHGMDHVNGGFAIKNTFGAFVEHNFLRQPGCDGDEFDCATD